MAHLNVQAFLTEIDVRKKEPEYRLDNVRRDHQKLMSVVGALRGKVEFMIDKQRGDFMTAYEHHIQDVVKEINYLREKVNEVANEKARKEKMDDLDKQQNMFKSEALSLDADTITMKKTLRILTGRINSLEKDRDWILKKLRISKEKFNRLREEKMRRTGQDALSIDNDSNSYIVELARDADLFAYDGDSLGGDSGMYNADGGMTKYASTGQLHNKKNGSQSLERVQSTAVLQANRKLNKMYEVSRDPSILPGSTKRESKPVRLEKLGSKASMSPMGLREVGPPTGKTELYVPEITSDIVGNTTEYTSEDAKARGRLVDLRARQETVRDFIAQCSVGLGKGPWSKIVPRPLGDIIEDCSIVVMDPVNRDKERLQLATELAGCIETYYVISDLMSGKYNNRNFRFGSSYEANNLDIDAPYDIMVNAEEGNSSNYYSDWGALRSVTDSVMKAQIGFETNNNRSSSAPIDEYYDVNNAKQLQLDRQGHQEMAFVMDDDLAGYLSRSKTDVQYYNS